MPALTARLATMGETPQELSSWQARATPSAQVPSRSSRVAWKAATTRAVRVLSSGISSVYQCSP